MTQRHGRARTLITRTITTIRSRFSLDSLAMYTLALVSEIPVIFARCIICYAITSIVMKVEGRSILAAAPWTKVGLIATLFSMLGLIVPFGSGWWWKQRSGGRRPSRREQLAYEDAIELLQAQTRAPLPLPKSWFVIDVPTPDAAVYGRTLMLSHGLLESHYLPAVIAHELGHLATPDGRLTAAINRLVLFHRPVPRREPGRYEATQPYRSFPLVVSDERVIRTIFILSVSSWTLRLIARLINGGLGLRLTTPLWGAYWRTREYKADHYAAMLGQTEDLAEFLENHALIHDHPIPFIWLTEHSHPPIELRIEKLRNHTPGVVAGRSEPVKGTPSGPPPAGPDGLPLTEP